MPVKTATIHPRNRVFPLALPRENPGEHNLRIRLQGSLSVEAAEMPREDTNGETMSATAKSSVWRDRQNFKRGTLEEHTD